MRKITFLIVSIIGASMLAGCGNDQYSIERRYWRTQKQADKIFKNPQVSPPNELERVVGLLSQFAAKNPGNILSVEGEFTIARLYIVKEEYEKGRQQLKALSNKYAKDKNICAQALFLTGNSYQIEDKWNAALEYYRRIMKEYPETMRGLEMPVYIAQYYKVNYQPDKMLGAYQEAIRHYKGLTEKYTNSLLGVSAYKLIAQCSLAMKDWENAVSTYSSMIDTYTGKVPLDSILMSMAVVYYRELKDAQKAQTVLLRLKKEYPRSRLVPAADKLLKEIGK